ncbi:TetR/AcrR family transcriptional regulator [Williamsia deligens]|uniref:TetR/AcrR family transcriptional regulator n=1 Tax=Williamsia deligens TaxID=321325 RepID=A0ABW3G6H4_9NOCA|nr:TetR/AcrR family transcriptional regulator [Williamsia deligens]MCP2193371.1 transcriptional regulator, TetR family [Williamsia deligens]
MEDTSAAVDRRGTGRRYGGRSTAARVAERRAALLEAGLDLFGTDGYQRVSVKQVCDRAGLTQRYFYESFDEREALLLAVYDEIVADVGRRTVAAIDETLPTIAELAQVALAEFIGYLTADRRRARIMLLEVVGVSPALDARRRRVIGDFADIIVTAGMAHAGLDETTDEFRLSAIGLVGAVNQLLVDWVLGEGVADPDAIRVVCTRLFSAAFAELLPR